MTYLLPDKLRDQEDQLRLWLQILRPFDARRPMSPTMQEAVVVYEQDRRLGERRQLA